jgi:tRNA pseudouridine55 synthase
MKTPELKHYIEDDILLVHKPIGISSFGLVAKMRKILGTRKIGHAGTLDPLASGLMILGINKGTKKIENYLKKDKTYIAEIYIGKSTTTGDREGDIVETKLPHKLDMTELNLDVALQSLLGEHYYPAPLYSAVKVEGRALYNYARAGETPPFIPEKLMNLKQVMITDIYKSGDFYVIKVRANVGSGTYIRTLAEEFGKKIGYPASLKDLYRLSIDKYSDLDSFHIEGLKKTKKSVTMRIYSLIQKILCTYFSKQKKLN